MLLDGGEYSMTQNTPKNFFSIVLVLTIILYGFSISPAEETSTEKVIKSIDFYDGKEVSVKGTVSNIKIRTTAGGKTFTTFKLVGESGTRVNVFTWGRLTLQVGQKVEVTGIYRKIMRVDQRIYNNQIDASIIK
jgi:hypothetical protein